MNDQRQLESALSALLFRATCPDGLQLGEYHAGLLTPEEQHAISAHLAGCPYCGRDLALTQRFMGGAQPARSQRQVQASWRVRVAQLLGALRAPQPALQVRGVAPEPIIYVVDDVQIALTVEPVANGVAIVGFVAGMVVTTADFWQRDQLSASVPVDESGSFAVDQLAAGTYQLLLRSAESAVEIPTITLP